ncbi:unnamed protein product [Closterium sp. Yama58-4]|nr:unnamed protein product [Closterium sp. Yama58-4]
MPIHSHSNICCPTAHHCLREHLMLPTPGAPLGPFERRQPLMLCPGSRPSIQRYYWKLDLVERRQQRLQEPPVPLLEALQAHALATGEEAALPASPAAAAGSRGPVSASAESGSAADGSGSADSGPGLAAGELEFRRVECEGRYDDARSLFVGPRAHTVRGAQEKGYLLVTPLLPPPGSQQPAVLVNRGWVPEAVRREAEAWMAEERARGGAGEAGKEEVERGGSGTSRSGGGGSSSGSSSGGSSSSVSVKGSSRGWFGSRGAKGQASTEAETAGSEPNAPPVIRVSGVVRASEKPNHFVPPNTPEHGEWFWVDVPAMAHACGLPRGTLLLDAMRPTEEEEEERTSGSSSSGGGSSIDSQAGVCPAFYSDHRFPRPKDPEELVKLPVMPADHITYAATWFSLFTATSVMAYKRLRVVPRKHWCSQLGGGKATKEEWGDGSGGENGQGLVACAAGGAGGNGVGDAGGSGAVGAGGSSASGAGSRGAIGAGGTGAGNAGGNGAGGAGDSSAGNAGGCGAGNAGGSDAGNVGGSDAGNVDGSGTGSS